MQDTIERAGRSPERKPPPGPHILRWQGGLVLAVLDAERADFTLWARPGHSARAMRAALDMLARLGLRLVDPREAEDVGADGSVILHLLPEWTIIDCEERECRW